MKLIDLVNLMNESKTEDETPAKAPAPEGEEVTTAQAAKILGVSMGRVRQYKKDGKLTASSEPEPGSRDNKFKLSAVEKLKGEQGSDGELERTGRPKGSKNGEGKDD